MLAGPAARGVSCVSSSFFVFSLFLKRAFHKIVFRKIFFMRIFFMRIFFMRIFSIRILSIGILPESISSMYKKFLTYEQQIEHLQSKGLCIPNNQNAATILEQIGYFPLIEAYKKVFLHKPSGQFLYGVTFDEIVCFYKFDEELRSLFLKYILHIERCMKSLISYYFCAKHGKSSPNI